MNALDECTRRMGISAHALALFETQSVHSAYQKLVSLSSLSLLLERSLHMQIYYY